MRCLSLGSVAVFALACVSGCDSGRRSAAEFVPSQAAALTALEAALDAWKAGQPPGRIDSLSPPAVVIDAQRKPGQTLKGYEILGEVPSSGQRWFSVRLILQNPSQEAKVRYVIVGIDPLWVMRQEDYDMVMHWDTHMGAKPATPP